MQKTNQNKFFVFEIVASQMAALNCLYYEGNTCHGKSIR